MTDISIKEVEHFVNSMKNMSFLDSLKVVRNILVIGVSLAFAVFLVGFAWNKASPAQPPAQIIINIPS